MSAWWRATAATSAPQSVTWGSPGVLCSASMSSQARSILRLFKGSAATFAGALPVGAELVGEDGLVLLHEVGGGLDEGVADLPGVLSDQLFYVAVDAHATSQGTLTRRAGGALVHAYVQLSLRHT